MDETGLRRLLAAVRTGDTTLDEAVRRLRGAPYEQLGDLATLDTHRVLRVGLPEVVLAEAKTAAQVAAIAVTNAEPTMFPDSMSALSATPPQREPGG